jgi:hypothetical protein
LLNDYGFHGQFLLPIQIEDVTIDGGNLLVSLCFDDDQDEFDGFKIERCDNYYESFLMGTYGI